MASHTAEVQCRFIQELRLENRKYTSRRDHTIMRQNPVSNFRCVLSGWHLRWDFHKSCWKTILQADTPFSFLWQFAGYYHLAFTSLSKPWVSHLTWLAFGEELACSGQPFLFPRMNIGQKIILSGCHLKLHGISSSERPDQASVNQQWIKLCF